MGNKYELGRVQGVSVWYYDSEMMGTGIVSRQDLEPKDIDPLVGDAIIDSTGQYWKITGIADDIITSVYVTRFGTRVNGETLDYATYEDIVNLFK